MAIERMACTPKSLPRAKWVAAADHACAVNPANRAPIERLVRVMRGFTVNKQRLSVSVKKYWGAAGVKLTVGFLDTPPTDLRKRILLHMNAWSKFANVAFVESRVDPDVRISRQGGEDGGYWSYVGTDIHHIPDGQPTMNLEAFTMQTPESEFIRVIRHETGHTLGFPHEHMRQELIAKIDREKAIKHFMATQGWSRAEVIAQVLTPISAGSLWGTAHADGRSIMCYQIPGKITKDGKPIPGGLDIDKEDADFAAVIYPKKVVLKRPAKPVAERKKAAKKKAVKRRK